MCPTVYWPELYSSTPTTRLTLPRRSAATNSPASAKISVCLFVCFFTSRLCALAFVRTCARCGQFLSISWHNVVCEYVSVLVTTASPAILAEPFQMPFKWQPHSGPRNCIRWDVLYMGATCWIWLNNLCLVAVRAVATITVIICSFTVNSCVSLIMLISVLYNLTLCCTFTSRISVLYVRKIFVLLYFSCCNSC